MAEGRPASQVRTGRGDRLGSAGGRRSTEPGRTRQYPHLLDMPAIGSDARPGSRHAGRCSNVLYWRCAEGQGGHRSGPDPVAGRLPHLPHPARTQNSTRGACTEWAGDPLGTATDARVVGARAPTGAERRLTGRSGRGDCSLGRAVAPVPCSRREMTFALIFEVRQQHRCPAGHGRLRSRPLS
jgi:hypothetical protein